MRFQIKLYFFFFFLLTESKELIERLGSSNDVPAVPILDNLDLFCVDHGGPVALQLLLLLQFLLLVLASSQVDGVRVLPLEIREQCL